MNRVLSFRLPYSRFFSDYQKKKKKKRPSFSSIYRKIITIEIIDRDQYQRNETFLVRLDEPSLIKDPDEPERLGM